MRIAVIHEANLGFFPRFYLDLCSAVGRSGDTIALFSPNSGQNLRRPLPNQITWGYRWNWFVHFNLYRLTGLQDIYSFFSTKQLVKKLCAYHPDIIHMHVVNQCDINFPMLVNCLNKLNVPVVWTFHDTRTITARCASFEEDQCFQWQTGCRKCTANAIYTKSYINNVYTQWKIRKKWFNKINNLTIVTPSQWLANHVKNSFFKCKDIRVLHNGIDTSGFSAPTGIEVESLKGITGKILLGVAVGWEHRKGLDTMIWLSKHLPSDHHIVLVGGVRPDLMDSIPENIICLPRTNSKEELIAIYQRANVYVNPTLADNFPTVNIEALGAGIPVVTFNTGGSAECLNDKCGISVPKGDNEAMLNAILKVTSNPEGYTKENSIDRSKLFSNAQYDEYIKLYHSLCEK